MLNKALQKDQVTATQIFDTFLNSSNKSQSAGNGVEEMIIEEAPVKKKFVKKNIQFQ